MKQKGMRKIVFALCFLLLLQTVSLSAFALPELEGGDAGGDTTPNSDNNNLATLTIDNGTLIPDFSVDQTEYVIVGDGLGTPITVTGTTENLNATILCAVANSPSRNPIVIQAAPREVSVDFNVTAEDGSVKTYHIKVYNDDGLSINPSGTLGDLSILSGPLTPAFVPFQPYYAKVVGNRESMISLMAIPMEPDSDMTLTSSILPFPIPIGFGSPESVPLNVGFNRLDISVSNMMSPFINTYSIIVFREAAPIQLSSNKDLSGLTISQGTLSPEFNAATKVYTATVASDTTAITVTGTAADSKATVSVDGGSASKAVRLNEETGTRIPILVTAEDGSEQTYLLTVTKEVPAPIIEKNNLSRLTVSGGTLYPAFSADQTEYLIVVNPQVQPDPDSGNLLLPPEIRVSGKPESSDAILSVADIKGNLRGAMLGPILSAEDGSKQIEFSPSPDGLLFRFDVTSPDNSRKSYTIKVVSEMPEPVKLSDLTINQGTLSPAFDPEQETYAATVAHETRSITVAGLASKDTASVRVNGKSASEVIALVEKETEIEIVVTAEYETDQKTYTLTVTKADPTPLSGNNDLSGLIISQGSLTPDFEAGKTNYLVSVERNITSLTLTATLADEKASMTINGDGVSSGVVSMPIELNEELTTIPLVVEAEDGMVKTYLLKVIKEAKSVGRMHPLVQERTFGGRTIARFEDSRFGLIVQKDESGLIDYRVPLRSKAKELRVQIPYGDLMAKTTNGARDLILNVRGHEIKIPMTVFEGDWLSGMPAGIDSTFEIHLLVDEAGQITYTIDFLVVEQVNESTRLVHRKSVLPSQFSLR